MTSDEHNHDDQSDKKVPCMSSENIRNTKSLHNQESSVARILKQCFSSMQGSNHRLSLRAFAAKAKMNHSALSEVLSGKRRLSLKKAEQIVDALKMSPQMRAEFLSDFHQNPSHEPLERNRLKADQFELIARWYFLAILSLARTEGFRYDTGWISRRLGITLLQAQTALDTLARLNLLRLSEDGKPLLSPLGVTTSDDIINKAIQQFHMESLAQAQAALQSVPIDERYLTSMTIALNARQMPRVKELIRQLLDDVDQLTRQDPVKTDVYKINVQFFGLSHPAE